MKKSIVILLALLVVAGCSAAGGPQSGSSQEMANLPKVAVEIETIKNGDIQESKKLIGNIEAASEIQVFPDLTGELVDLQVENGDQVEAGQVLAILDGENQMDSLQLEQKTVESARQQLNNAILTREQAEQRLKDAQTSEEGTSSTDLDLENLTIALEDAQTNRERLERLYEEGAVSLQDLERAQQQETQAQISLEKAQLNTGSNLEQLQLDLEKAQVGVQQSQTSLDQAQLRLSQAQRNVNDTTVYAPISGVIKGLDIEVGENASTQQPLLTITNVSEFIITTQITAEQKRLVPLGTEVEVHSSVKDGYKAEVIYISPTRNDIGLFDAELRFTETDDQLTTGEVVQLVFSSTLVEDEVLVPTHAIIQKGNEAYVFLANEGKAVKKEVEILNMQSNLTAVKGDLEAGDDLIINGHKLVSDGMLILLPSEQQTSEDETQPDEKVDEETNSEQEKSDDNAAAGGGN
ncbi:efflux RND transporter periplasmic adaptor subunit [Chengkuizengella axinellae]|uniref:Efflux RND transporter periplasmic adaptor subunit n=1 Tax=Chengkuizengella axinellae TaxID=3064388 RepID=A0ABT9IYR5_9BACL|nr:efflux RND transporter periplasmic adaptor subunit [Chengkuizengella sp. 2205SS18-9]MDP5274509.1 efflux RND transporter periplasmic adaptor subunit [Chengkuizengella sp. 2205SS18-9]